jgi:hypothetical protein
MRAGSGPLRSRFAPFPEETRQFAAEHPFLRKRFTAIRPSSSGECIPLPDDRVHNPRRQDEPLHAVFIDELNHHVIPRFVANRLDDEGFGLAGELFNFLECGKGCWWSARR